MAFEYMQFTDAEGNWCPEFQAYYDAIGAAGCANYDCNEAALAFKDGMTPQEAAEWINELRADDDPEPVDFEDRLNRDFSMNG